ncbi:MAG: endolytic transglycosylase MltG [Ruminococcus sp.]|nr:endolytic transglycosylase MltG [Ruminococcus sp.]
MSDNKNDEVLDGLLNEIGEDSSPEPLEEAAALLEDAAASREEEEEAAEDYDPDSPKEFDLAASEEEDYYDRPVRRSAPPRRRKRKRKKARNRNRVSGILILVTLILSVSICLSLVIIAFGKDIMGIGKNDSTHLMVIPEGSSTDEIASMLEEEGIIRSPECFKLFSRLRKSDEQYIAGEHFVRPNMAYEAIIDELTSIHEEEQETVEIAFPEGINIYEAANILEENGICSASEFIFYFNSGGYGFKFEEKLPSDTTLKLNRMEGYVFPDTYFFYTNMEPEQVCQKIYLNFDSKMTDERYQKMEELGLNLDSLITLASIVQKEAATTDTMTMVASVFWNRLRNPEIFPLLQSDPTSNYANDVVRPHMDVYDKTIIDAYDTYVGPGLPPGAICNPGLEAIDAVLADVKSNYFYFIANIFTGKTEFSESLEEHEAYQEEIASEEDEYIASSKAAEAEAEQEAASNGNN